MTEDRDNAGETQGERDSLGRWKPGVSGNPAGCQPGSRHRATKAVEGLLDGQAEALTQRAVEMALGGDATAMRLCLERIMPARKDSPVRVDLPQGEGIENIAKATEALVTAAANGQISPSEAEAMGKLIELHRKAIETVDIERRLKALEQGK